MAWTKYKQIKYAAGGIPSANLTDFPKLVSINTDSDIAAELSGGGGIKFTSADGVTDLAFGLYPSTNLAAGTILARFKAGSLLTSASVGDVIARLYYSSTGTTSENKAGTVSSVDKLFIPLEQDPSGSAPQELDWVSNSNVGTSHGSMTSGDLVSAKVGNGLDFDGSDDYVDTSSFAAIGGAFTLRYIVKSSGTANGVSLASNSPLALYLQESGAGGTLTLNISTDVTAFTGFNISSVLDGNYHDIVIRYDGSTCKAYVDGSQTNSISLTGNVGAFGATWTLLQMGSLNGANFANCVVDEVWLNSSAFSVDWISYLHTDDFSNSSTFTLSAEQGGGAATLPFNNFPMLPAI